MRREGWEGGFGRFGDSAVAGNGGRVRECPGWAAIIY